MKQTASAALGTLLLLLFCCGIVSAQDSLSHHKKLFNIFSNRFEMPSLPYINDSLHADSSIRKKLKAAFARPDSASLVKGMVAHFKPPTLVTTTKPFLKPGSGYINYTYTYRSGKDSSVIDNNVAQHLITGSFNATIANLVPVRVTYFERQSNSPYFKDFRDVTVDVDVNRYRQLKMQKAVARLKNSYSQQLDPSTTPALSAVDTKLDQYKSLLNDPKLMTELIRSKETLIRTDFPDTSLHYIDSVTRRAKQFIEMYDSLQAKQTAYQHLHDSLYQVYRQAEAGKNKLQQLLNNPNISAKDITYLQGMYEKDNTDLEQLRKANNGIRKLALGRTYPSYTNLTLQNINVNGINVEYVKDNYYFAAAAGLVDFRIRDFLFSDQKLPRQYVYAARAGYGRRESDHLILTYFRGRKQLFGGNLQTPSSPIQGVSLAAQVLIERHTRIYGEIAQSGVPYTLGGNNSSKPAISFNDNSQRAYAAGFASYFPRTQTLLEGYYQHSGLNYQSFNSFQYNAAANSWSFRFEQSAWKRQLVFQASLRKNDFVNPLVLQRYNANTVFKSFTLSLRKSKWPLVSVGYQPASQYTVVGNQVYENHYQSFNGNISHSYKLGIARAATTVSFSQFFNDRRDSGFVYYNSKNFFVAQTFLFTRFTATVNVSGMNNGRHQLIVMEEGLSATLFKAFTAGFAIKINNLDKNINKIGFNAKTRINMKKIGELNVWMEQSYLPGLQQEFYKYEMYNIGLTRYFR